MAVVPGAQRRRLPDDTLVTKCGPWGRASPKSTPPAKLPGVSSVSRADTLAAGHVGVTVRPGIWGRFWRTV